MDSLARPSTPLGFISDEPNRGEANGEGDNLLPNRQSPAGYSQNGLHQSRERHGVPTAQCVSGRDHEFITDDGSDCPLQDLDLRPGGAVWPGNVLHSGLDIDQFLAGNFDAG